MITGGEPTLVPKRVEEVVEFLSDHDYLGKLYLYSALYDEEIYSEYGWLNVMDGVHFTLHAEATDEDVNNLKLLSETIKDYEDRSFRLAIDKRLYEKYDFSNIDFSGWSVVRKMVWKNNCPLPKDEKLFIWKC